MPKKKTGSSALFHMTYTARISMPLEGSSHNWPGSNFNQTIVPGQTASVETVRGMGRKEEALKANTETDA